MAIRFLTDSTADILPQEAAQRDIDVVPLKVLFGETAYRDGIDLDPPTFYQMLSQSKALPTTSQPTPDDFLPYFERARDQGDHLICALLSSQLSGTVQSAQIAREMCGYEHIYIIDSTLAIVALRAMLDLGEQLRSQGMSAPDIAAQIEAAKVGICCNGYQAQVYGRAAAGEVSWLLAQAKSHAAAPDDRRLLEPLAELAAKKRTPREISGCV
mgnify:FL=1